MAKNIISIFGPTASGKTSLAIFLAQKLNGVVVNADSRQLYKNMPIITAMPSDEEFAAADHRLFNFLEVTDKISSELYASMAKKEIESIWAEGKLPILCGGTGFYIKTLEEGISPVPSVSQDMFTKLNDRVEKESVTTLYKELQSIDPAAAAKLSENDGQRITRALGVCLQSGKKFSDLQALPKTGALDAHFVKIALNPDRAWLYNRIHKRYDVMEDMGLLSEIEKLKSDGYKITDHAIQSCGVREFYKYLDGEWPLEDAKNALLQSTRNYAKRQYTWLKGQYNADIVFENSASGESAFEEIQSKLL